MHCRVSIKVLVCLACEQITLRRFVPLLQTIGEEEQRLGPLNPRPAPKRDCVCVCAPASALRKRLCANGPFRMA